MAKSFVALCVTTVGSSFIGLLACANDWLLRLSRYQTPHTTVTRDNDHAVVVLVPSRSNRRGDLVANSKRPTRTVLSGVPNPPPCTDFFGHVCTRLVSTTGLPFLLDG